MTYAVELFFDETTEARLVELWTVLGRDMARVPHFASPRYRPHVSLAVLDTDEPHALSPLAATYLDEVLGQPVQLSGLGMFLDPARTLAFLTVTGSEELARAQRQIAGVLGGAGARINPFSVPGSWTPHCTLPFDVAPHVPTLLSAVRSAGLPIRASWAEGRLVDFATEESVELLGAAP